MGGVGEAWPRPVPTIGDRTSASERALDPRGWAFSADEQAALSRIIAARRDIRRFRPDPVPDDVLQRILVAAHGAPSVGHSQPWRFVVVRDPESRARAAVMADRARLEQAAQMEPEAARHLLDLDLEGIREAPLGVVVCCDRRAPAEGVLGRATFRDADVWSCACAIENLWLAARAEGLGVGWVTLFTTSELADLVHAPDGVTTLGWLCVGWPDERPPTPGLERRGWSERQPLDSLILRERWPDSDSGSSAAAAPQPPRSRMSIPSQAQTVAAHDTNDTILTTPGSLGVLDRAVDKLLALGAAPAALDRGALLLAAADHPVTAHQVSAYDSSVTRDVAEAAIAGISAGAVAAAEAGLVVVVVDAGVDVPLVDGGALVSARPVDRKGDIVGTDALSSDDTERLVAAGEDTARRLTEGPNGAGVIVVGEVGVGNTTVASALAAALLDSPAGDLVGLGAGSDSAIVSAKRRVVEAAVERVKARGDDSPLGLLAALGGGEIAFLTGVVLGAAASRHPVVLDGMATCVAALVAVRLEPAAAAYLFAGQRSREIGHRRVLDALGLEPLLDLRFRAGEGAGAAMAVSLLRAGLRIRLMTARTSATT